VTRPSLRLVHNARPSFLDHQRPALRWEEELAAERRRQQTILWIAGGIALLAFYVLGAWVMS
jgi:hypothetical protein